MAKYMGDYYRTMTTYDLNVLRSKKFLRLKKLDKEARTYLNIQEARKLNEQIIWIDAELQCRRDQMAFDAI